MFGTSYTGHQTKQTNVEFIRAADKIKMSWAILPKTCARTNRKLWFVSAFKVKSGGETRWFDPIEFLVLSMFAETE